MPGCIANNRACHGNISRIEKYQGSLEDWRRIRGGHVPGDGFLHQLTPILSACCRIFLQAALLPERRPEIICRSSDDQDDGRSGLVSRWPDKAHSFAAHAHTPFGGRGCSRAPKELGVRAAGQGQPSDRGMIGQARLQAGLSAQSEAPFNFPWSAHAVLFYSCYCLKASKSQKAASRSACCTREVETKVLRPPIGPRLNPTAHNPAQAPCAKPEYFEGASLPHTSAEPVTVSAALSRGLPVAHPRPSAPAALPLPVPPRPGLLRSGMGQGHGMGWGRGKEGDVRV